MLHSKLFKINARRLCRPDLGLVKTKFEVKKEHKKLIIIPIASKEYNEKWTYSNKVNDWKCYE